MKSTTVDIVFASHYLCEARFRRRGLSGAYLSVDSDCPSGSHASLPSFPLPSFLELGLLAATSKALFWFQSCNELLSNNSVRIVWETCGSKKLSAHVMGVKDIHFCSMSLDCLWALWPCLSLGAVQPVLWWDWSYVCLPAQFCWLLHRGEHQ